MKILSRRAPPRLSARPGADLRWMTLAVGGPVPAAARTAPREAAVAPAEEATEGGIAEEEEASAPA